MITINSTWYYMENKRQETNGHHLRGYGRVSQTRNKCDLNQASGSVDGECWDSSLEGLSMSWTKSIKKREQGRMFGSSSQMDGVVIEKDRRDAEAALGREKSKIRFWTCSFERSHSTVK